MIKRKQEILEMVHSGGNVSEIANKEGISVSTIYRWISEEMHSSKIPEKFSLRNYQTLVNKNERLLSQIQILKEVYSRFQISNIDKYEAIRSYEGKYSVHTICDALDVPRGSYYNYILRGKQGKTAYDKHREELREKILKIYEDSHQIFGAKKITAILKEQNIRAGFELVQELMREMELKSIRNGSKSQYRKENPKTVNILKRNFSAPAPNKIWVADVTYFKFYGFRFYVAAILDLYSRKMIGYKISRKNSTNLVKAVFLKTYNERKPEPGLIFHTDRGSNYCSKTFERCLKENKAQHSYSAPGTPHDNAVIESFFSTLKREELYRHNYSSESEFRKSLDEYIHFYNTERPHDTLGNFTPQKFEERYFSIHKSGV